MKDDILNLGRDRAARPWRGWVVTLAMATLAIALLTFSLAKHLSAGPSAHAARPPTAHSAAAHSATRSERLDSPERPDGPVQLAGLGANAARLLNGRTQG